MLFYQFFAKNVGMRIICGRKNLQSYLSLGIQSNDADAETPTVTFLGFTKRESSRLVSFCPLDILELPENRHSLKKVTYKTAVMLMVETMVRIVVIMTVVICEGGVCGNDDCNNYRKYIYY